MPELDVSFLCMDPMLADSFDVIRQAETVVDGRTVVQAQLYPNNTGVVTQQDPAELMRREDGQMVPRRIFCASRFPFRGASAGFQPDIIVWNRTQYHVQQVYPYSRFGAGFYEVVASSEKATDVPQ